MIFLRISACAWLLLFNTQAMGEANDCIFMIKKLKMLLRNFCAFFGMLFCTSVLAQRDTIPLNNNWLFLINKNKQVVKQPSVEQSVNNVLAIVKDGWKYITPSNGPALMSDLNIETGFSKEDQLYNLKDDPKEAYNLAQKYPQRLEELKALLAKTKAE
jgi:hypothetical protein